MIVLERKTKYLNTKHNVIECKHVSRSLIILFADDFAEMTPPVSKKPSKTPTVKESKSKKPEKKKKERPKNFDSDDSDGDDEKLFKTKKKTGYVFTIYRVRTGPGKSWNFRKSFSRPGKSWNSELG